MPAPFICEENIVKRALTYKGCAIFNQSKGRVTKRFSYFDYMPYSKLRRTV
jgi:hypothetical protein